MVEAASGVRASLGPWPHKHCHRELILFPPWSKAELDGDKVYLVGGPAPFISGVKGRTPPTLSASLKRC